MPGGFGWVKGFQVGQIWWLAYQSYDLASVVAHPAHELRGYRWPAVDAFRLDVTTRTEKPELVWSDGNADAPQNIHLEVIDVTADRTALGPTPPPQLGRFWFGPNIGSLDELQTLCDPANLHAVDVVCLPIQQILTDATNDQLGPNIWPNLVANGIVRKAPSGTNTKVCTPRAVS